MLRPDAFYSINFKIHNGFTFYIFMDLERQLLFLFSALGALNGFLLSFYFAFFSKKRGLSNYFLSALLFVLSVRILKSVFFYFNPELSEIFIQIGLSACVLIGPFLYLYTKSLIIESKRKGWWLFHVIPVLVIVIVLSVIYPYWEHKRLWAGFFVKIIYLQWLLYIICTAILLKSVFKGLFSKEHKIKQIEIWVLSVFGGVSIIWMGYNIGSYTSYIVGALSFSFVFFLLILFWVLKRNKTSLFFEDTIKYADKKIDLNEASEFQIKLDSIIKEKELFKNPDLKLADVSRQLHVLPHYLSQFLNDNLGKSFPLFINEYRIQEAKQLLINEDNYTTEAVGYECGFNSKSTFYTTFKKIVGKTPAAYKKEAV